jgi:hypothetical protein
MNRLAFIGPFLGIGAKLEHEGFALWKKVMDGDENAQRRMSRYCSKMSECLRSYISKFDHISEVTLIWERPDTQNALHAGAKRLTVEEHVEHAHIKSSGYSVRIVGIGSTEREQKSDEQMGFAVPKPRKRDGDVEQRPVD